MLPEQLTQLALVFRHPREILAQVIIQQVPIKVSKKWNVLLPLEADEKLEALKHYFRITYNGGLVTRGIETRRHDAPEFIKQFQTELLYTLFDCNTFDDIFNKNLENALFCVTKTIDKIMTGETNPKDLVISKQLRIDITQYRNIFPHVAAAIQLVNANGKLPVRGETIQ